MLIPSKKCWQDINAVAYIKIKSWIISYYQKLQSKQKETYTFNQQSIQKFSNSAYYKLKNDLKKCLSPMSNKNSQNPILVANYQK